MDPNRYRQLADELLGATNSLGDMSKKAAPKKPEKGVAWQAKVIDGAYYIPLSQVAELLATNSVLPAVRKGIEARVQAQADRKKAGM